MYDRPPCDWIRPNRFAGLVCGFLWTAAATLAVGAEIPIDDFENPAAFSRWTFYNGAEFPGATGSLARAEGHFGSGAHLAYDFTGGGAYVSANFTLPTPLTGAALARAVIAAVHQADPGAKVLTGGLAGPDHRFARGFLSLGGGEGADGVGVHPYLREPEALSDHLLNLRAIVEQTVPANPPLYDTEWGFSSTWYGDGQSTEARLVQAQRVPCRLLASWAAGLPLMIYYDIRDDGLQATNAEHNFGPLARDYSDKPAMTAVRTLSALSQGRLFTGFYALESSEVTAMRLDGPSNLVVALWPHVHSGDIDLRVPANATVSGSDENTWHTQTLAPSALHSGINLAAVEVHQSSLDSSDVSFDFELSATVATLTQVELGVSMSQGGLVLSWPWEAGLLSLGTTTNLTPPIAWVLATNLPVLRDGRWTVSLDPATGETRFYRLQ